jgi:WD40 repeat protein
MQNGCDVTTCAVDPHMRKIFLGDHHGLISAFATAHGRLIGTYERDRLRQEVSILRYVETDDMLISVADRTITVLDARVNSNARRQNDLRLPTLRRMLDAHDQKISTLSFSRRLSLIATSSPGRSVRLWDFQTLRLEDVCLGLSDDAIALEFVEPYSMLIVVSLLCVGRRGYLSSRSSVPRGTRPQLMRACSFTACAHYVRKNRCL